MVRVFAVVREMPKLKVSETALASQVEDLFRLFNWRFCHFRPAWSSKGYRTPITGHKGFPDYVAVRPPRLLFIELKDDYSKLTAEQEEWMDDLKECSKTITFEPIKVNNKMEIEPIEGRVALVQHPEVYLWRPSDIDKIVELLR